jgi:Cysteine protease
MRIACPHPIFRATMVVLAAAVCVIFAAAPAVAAPALRQAPQNPAFKLHGQALAAHAAVQGNGVAALGAASGLVPSPVDIGALSSSAPVGASASSLPSSFDLRSAAPARLSPVENQGSFGTCWAFASMDSLESALWSASPGDTSRFSEDNLALKAGFFSGLSPTELYNEGGNSLMATAYLARWAGPVLLSQDAYGDNFTPSGLTVAKHVQDVLYVPGRRSATDNNGIKTAVMDYGAVYVPFCWDAARWQNSTSAYYNPKSQTLNHAVDIVGWNDNYPAGNFATKPPGNGAFIVRNSWGADFGDGGYFYLSYYDANLALDDVSSQEDGNAVFVAAQPSDNYDTAYQYDPLGWTTSIGYGSPTGWFANRFTASRDGSLRAVSFYAASPGSTYTVSEGPSTASLSRLASGTFDLAGYHTVALGSSPTLPGGSAFVVAVKLTTPGYTFPIPAEYPWTSADGYSAAAAASPGQSYVSADGSTWTDLTTMDGYGNTNVCLKAFADSASAPATRASGAGASWHRRAVTLTFKASDGKVGSSIARTEYRVDPVGAAAWQTGTSVMLPAPSDHSNDGVHTVEYRSVDNAGNTEATRTCSVKIDTRKPRPYANWAASVVRGHRARLRFYIGDPRPGSSRVTAVIKIRSLAASSGKTIVVHGSLNSSLSASFVCWLARGSYRFTISATDAAGNTQTAPASNRLTVHQGDG